MFYSLLGLVTYSAAPSFLCPFWVLFLSKGDTGVYETQVILKENICKITFKTVKLYRCKEEWLVSVEMFYNVILLHHD